MSGSGKETTFRAFTGKQGANYAQNRRDYHPRLYDAIIDHHRSTGGQFDVLLDVGCGPGIAARRLAPLFRETVAIDPSEGMIETARSLASPEDPTTIRFAVSSAEELGSDLSPPDPVVDDGTVDLITAATAAHWFDMPRFWASAARRLKPGGTVALWCSGPICVSPATPNHGAIQAAIDRLRDMVDEYMTEGNRMAQDRYVDLVLPWTVPTVPEAVGEMFDKSSFVRKEWGTEEGMEPGDQFYNVPGPASLDILTKVIETTSPVIRWREAHPEKVGTEEDVVVVMRREIETAFREAGVVKGAEALEGGVTGVLLLVKRCA